MVNLPSNVHCLIIETCSRNSVLSLALRKILCQIAVVVLLPFDGAVQGLKVLNMLASWHGP